MARVRDYQEIAQRLRALPQDAWRVEQVGRVWGYPFYRVRRQIDRRLPTVLLTAGFHGEEPGGVEGALRWLEGGEWAKWRVNWFVLPCINPYGWERNQRRNAQGRDINRQFRHPAVCPEAQVVTRLVKGRRFLFLLDFHEDVDSPGYYLYELRREPQYIGERIVAARCSGHRLRVLGKDRVNLRPGHPRRDREAEIDPALLDCNLALEAAD